jgi:hypothetical protein
MKTIAAYRHPATDSAQEPDTQPGDYFVSVLDGGRHALVSGPYVNDHAAALADVEHCRTLAEKHDARAVFYAFGTVRLASKSGKVGQLQRWGVYDLDGVAT